MRKLSAGIIGLGEVAQTIHLPVLELYPEQFGIGALCDASPSLLRQFGAQYGVENLYTDALELVKQPDLDVILILNSTEYHHECAVAAANAGKHVLVEKPMCLTMSEADSIIEARDRNGVKVMVGYMRRYAAPFVQGLKEIQSIGNIHYARVRDIIGPNHAFVAPVHRVQRADDIPQALMADRKARANKALMEAIGEGEESEYGDVYFMLCGLSSHDLSAMREALGMPRGVIGAKLSRNGAFFLNVIFDYDAFTVTFETGIDEQGRFDAHLEVYGAHKSVRVQYDTPYHREAPATLHVVATNGEHFAETTSRPTFKDPYRLQLEHLYDAIVNDFMPKTSPEDYKQDLVLFRMIIDALRRSNR
ncbi:Gfo/Idh/MocA family protein [Cohnella fermenti]|uniref:Gfo/Idh/MocA family oxidoreductase n=1 Tax=Cohnella fermenti TaxID=2565925 RepID=A0A4S4BJX6_9BACL|nr:Gfo/Idh/MocA family oxidoreductase [Cohnella fermenti]THF74425.1 Gfo/Idh/MocA family oxidoreductase [Cohnella fermenti]